MTPDLLRDTLREVLYGPSGGYGLFSEGEAGLLRAAHALSFAQAVTPVAPGRPTPAQIVAHLRQSLEWTAAQLADPHALLPDPEAAWAFAPGSPERWRDELVALARAGQTLMDALYLPLTPQGWRTAQGGVVHAAYHTGALRFFVHNLR